MRLNYKDKELIRKTIEDKMDSIPDDCIIKIDKVLLSQLIFDYRYKENLKKEVKYIAWSGPFLQKIDLSEISFSNVLWDGRYSNGLDLSNTNAYINFLTEADYHDNSSISLYLCNLENVDLKYSNAEVISTIIDCNLKNTNASLLFNHYINEHTLNVKNSNLENIDLSNVEINESLLCGGEVVTISNCNLKNTGIKIFFHSVLSDEEKNNLSELIINKYIDGCYINGRLIASEEEKQKNAKIILETYEYKKEELINETLKSIDKQVRTYKK